MANVYWQNVYFQISRRRRRGRVRTCSACMARAVSSTWAVRATTTWVVRGACAVIWRTTGALMVAGRRVGVTDRRTGQRANCGCSPAACKPTSKSLIRDRATVCAHTVIRCPHNGQQSLRLSIPANC